MLVPALLLFLQAPDPAALFERAREYVRDVTERQVNFTCSQRVKRVEYPPPEKRNDCAGSYDKTTPILEDRIHLEIAAVDAREVFAWPNGPRFETDEPSKLIEGGTTGTGDFHGFLIAVFLAGGAKVHYSGPVDHNGGRTLEYAYEVPVTASGYEVVTPSRRIKVAFEGIVRIDAGSAIPLLLTVHVPHPPLELRACRVTTVMDLQSVKIETGTLLIPSTTRLSLYRPNGSWTLNETSYEACRAFRAQSTITFDPLPEGEAGEVKTSGPPPVLPKGAMLAIELKSPIDSDTNWVGDYVKGVLMKDLRGGSGDVYLPKGTIVNGRIIRLRHMVLQKKESWMLGLRFESFNWQGQVVPLHLEPADMLDRPSGYIAESGNYTFTVKRMKTPSKMMTRWQVAE